MHVGVAWVRDRVRHLAFDRATYEGRAESTTLRSRVGEARFALRLRAPGRWLVTDGDGDRQIEVPAGPEASGSLAGPA